MITNAKNDYLPDKFSFKTLEKNLETINLKNPKLVQRISWPVDNTHITFENATRPLYRLHTSSFDLSLSKDAIDQNINNMDNNKDFFIFGIGLGEHIDIILEKFPDKKISVWENDPWLLRLFLMQNDYSEYLSAGSLKLFLGSDLIHLIPRLNESTVIYHPFLKKIYYNEAELISSGIGENRVIINTGGLFVDDAVKALKKVGYTAYFLNFNGISIEEIEYTIIQFKPNFIFSINYQNGLSELCKRFSITMLCWEIDHTIDMVNPLSEKNDNAYIFSYRHKNVNEFLSAGFDHVKYLSLATDPEKRQPVILSKKDKDNYAVPIAFIGNTLSEQAQQYKKTLTDLYKEYCLNHNINFDESDDPFNKILETQRQDYTVYQIPELFQQRLNDFTHYFHEKMGNNIDPVKLLAETAAVEKRLIYVSRLSELGIKVWGDTGWKSIENTTVKYMGEAGHHHEINKIYSTALINIEVNRIYQPEIVTMRVFDVMACGGFLIAEYAEDMEALFDLERELVTYQTLDELLEKTSYYLENQHEAKEIAAAGMKAVQERHTIEKRVEYMLDVVNKKV